MGLRAQTIVLLLLGILLMPLPALAVQLGGAGDVYPEIVPGTLEVTHTLTAPTLELSTLTVSGTIDVMGGIRFSDGTTQSSSVATSAVTVVFDGGDADIAAGIKTDIVMPFSCVIQEVTVLSSQEGSIVIDIWKDSYSNFPPTEADSITASAKPTISSSNKSKDSTLSGWTKTLSGGDILRVVVDSCTGIRNCMLSLTVLRN